MLVTTLPYPGIVVGSNKLRRAAAKSISAVESAARSSGVTPVAEAAKLTAFFQACADAAALTGKART